MKNKSKCNPYCDFTDSSLVATVKFSKMQNFLKNVSFKFRCYIIEADKTLRRDRFPVWPGDRHHTYWT